MFGSFLKAVFVNFAAMEQNADFRIRMLAFRGAGGGPPAGSHLPANRTGVSHLALQSTRFNNGIASQSILNNNL
ncbi:hypothetical protein BIV59_04010 [Bacillus sp. MUM 13]|nr:hypothetical protein BIV59_04010 [Bacillus sp. MUM 13]